MPRVEGESRFASLRINHKEPGVESVQGIWKKLGSKWDYRTICEGREWNVGWDYGWSGK